jgi:glycosyltransferase involved in cell wall biosynthesis
MLQRCDRRGAHRIVRIAIVTDAWAPQVNGVAVTLVHTIAEVERAGHEVLTITPNGFVTVPMPTYPEIPLAVLPGREVSRRLDASRPDAVHIATEGPLGQAARRYCLRHNQPFTTAYHTQFPEYMHARCRFPLAVSYAWLRRFHAPSRAVLCATETLHRRLEARGFRNLVLWSRGVDTTLFAPAQHEPLPDERPIFLYVGRLAVEKSIEAFLALDLPGTKWVVGDGPAREGLARAWPSARYFGAQHGAALVRFYQQADVFVFPSRTDTFGLVLLEAMACGTPVAAFPVPGPIDVVTDADAGVLDADLRAAALAAMALDRSKVRRHAARFSWEAATRDFIANLNPRSQADAKGVRASGG